MEIIKMNNPELLSKIKEHIILENRVSVRNIQRVFSLNHAETLNYLMELESLGVVSKPDLTGIRHIEALHLPLHKDVEQNDYNQLLKALKVAEKYMPDKNEVTEENYPENNKSILLDIEFVKNILFSNGVKTK
jgi:hypothetical protein